MSETSSATEGLGGGTRSGETEQEDGLPEAVLAEEPAGAALGGGPRAAEDDEAAASAADDDAPLPGLAPPDAGPQDDGLAPRFSEPG